MYHEISASLKTQTLAHDLRRLVLEAAGKCTTLAVDFRRVFSPVFPSLPIISERSSSSRVRSAAPNNGAPLTTPGRSGDPSYQERKAQFGTGAPGTAFLYTFWPPPTSARRRFIPPHRRSARRRAFRLKIHFHGRRSVTRPA